MLNQRCKWLVKSQLIFSNQSWKATKITLFELNELKLSCYQLSINFAFLPYIHVLLLLEQLYSTHDTLLSDCEAQTDTLFVLCIFTEVDIRVLS